MPDKTKKTDYTESATYSAETELAARIGAGLKLSTNPHRGYTLASMDTFCEYNAETGMYDATCTLTWKHNTYGKTRVK